MKLIIHDLDNDKFNSIFPKDDDSVVVSANNTVRNCIGCFGCWIKTPGNCVIKDSFSDMGELISKCSQLIIISKCSYGGYSPYVKTVIDRGLSYVHPYFQIRNNEMHHRRRHTNVFETTVYFYGNNILDQEKETAKKIVQGNVVNYDGKLNSVNFVENIDSIGGML